MRSAFLWPGDFRLTDQERFSLDPESGLPLYLQIAHEFIYRIETGILKTDDKLPGIRKLAKELGVSFLTVDKAYKWLGERRVVAAMPGVGVKVILTLDSAADAKQRKRLSLFAEKVVADAVKNRLDLMLMAQTVLHRARTHQSNAAAQKLLFVECLPEYVDDYIAELRRALAESNVDIQGILTTDLDRAGIAKKGGGSELDSADYVMTTLYHYDFVQRKVERHGIKVVALSHTLDQDAIRRIVSIPQDRRIGVLLGPVDPPRSIIKTIEFYRDLAPGSISFAVITDPKAVRSLVAKSEILIHTTACSEFIASLPGEKPDTILIRFVPDQEAINKTLMLLNRDKNNASRTLRSGIRIGD
jgi:GntR family transcriptional regulator